MKSLNKLEAVQPKNCDPNFNNNDQVAPGNRLPQSCPKITTKLPQSCPKVAPKLPQSCPKVASKQISKWVIT